MFLDPAFQLDKALKRHGDGEFHTQLSAHFDIPNFRVLTVTTSRERVEHLVAACQSLSGGGSRLFVFTDQESLGRGDILTHECVNGRGEIARLLAKTNSPRSALPPTGNQV
jgi:hypothetical protein